ncbi:ribosome small subunit-dependent GTPase A [Pseudodesulfovibrio senegalensis]|uniref:Small ribosomal subunit biogenesis GTPase RsgA n=1 Tax=Pseudodesulfovibrio senegalensis TaxID=1721087 RepID=A0A6N6N2S7_9BACT|nr:ribosome small subunit-dependent GTPase A [Pseudodesulfovibrio senegalensis]KAB1441336.1 ribosome small subunit-dependent GTPase A [Pseudodesulfovibrio senegalensis]
MTIYDNTGTDPAQRIDRLNQLGWDDLFEHHLATMDRPHARVARVLSAQRGRFLVGNGHAEWLCAPAGRLLRREQHRYPVTGDWVLTKESVITEVLPRRNMLCRGRAGARGKQDETARNEQPMGANMDTAFIVCGLDRDYNLRRLERYLALVYNCGIAPVIVLTKADLVQSPATYRQEVEQIAFGVPVVPTSMTDRTGVDELRVHFGHGKTVIMLGSSGAGKSTLANLLHGSDIQATASVSQSVGKGRHTTTARELIPMPGGGLLMDNPGIREIAFYTDGSGLDGAFPEIRELSESCRFADCTHQHEPGCAVLRAVASGDLGEDRLASYHKMKREMEYVSARSEKSADRVEKERWKDVALRIKRMKKKR